MNVPSKLLTTVPFEGAVFAIMARFQVPEPGVSLATTLMVTGVFGGVMALSSKAVDWAKTPQGNRKIIIPNTNNRVLKKDI